LGRRGTQINAHRNSKAKDVEVDVLFGLAGQDGSEEYLGSIIKLKRRRERLAVGGLGS
jgi:hypothetical protein